MNYDGSMMDIDQTLAKLESYEQELLEMWLGVSNCIGALYVMHGKKRVYRMVPKSTIGSCVEQPIGSELEK